MRKDTTYSPVVLYKEDIQSVINALLASGHDALAGMIDAKARRSKSDGRYVAALPSLDDGDFDVDDEPVVSPGEGGAYVMVWRWVTNVQAGICATKGRSQLMIS